LSALMLVVMGAVLIELSRPNGAHATPLRKRLATIGRRSTD